jgi:predicted metal-binding membrane protein
VTVAIAVAWVLAMVAQWTGAAARAHHGALSENAPLWAALLLFLIAWQVMLAAMMLPSSLPLMRMFEAASRNQPRTTTVRVAFLAGYAAVWTLFGAVAFVADVALYRTINANDWLAARAWLIAPIVLAVAGAFQFSSLKERCLQKCRHPAPYMLAHYRRGVRGALRLGSGHGLFCLGCCWALMLVMFATGVAMLWWMAVLTASMVYEKTGRRGDLVSPFVGIALLGLAVLSFMHPGVLGTPHGHH